MYNAPKASKLTVDQCRTALEELHSDFNRGITHPRIVKEHLAGLALLMNDTDAAGRPALAELTFAFDELQRVSDWMNYARAAGLEVRREPDI